MAKNDKASRRVLPPGVCASEVSDILLENEFRQRLASFPVQLRVTGTTGSTVS